MLQNPDIQIPVGKVMLKSNMFVPAKANAIVVFVHGSGSSRLSPRNIRVAEYLQQQGFGTLLFDLLTTQEDETYASRFDIALLTERLIKVTGWLQTQSAATGKSMGYFGASTGGAAAISAAAALPEVKAVVSRGGRPDLAGEALKIVRSATLLIVGGADHEVLQLNYNAFDKMNTVKALKIVEGATHLFEEPGAMEEVMHLAVNWFRKYLR
jgi:dienelactone hydrolase